MFEKLKTIYKELITIKNTPGQGLGSPEFQSAFERLIALAEHGEVSPEIQRAVKELDEIRGKQGFISSAFLRSFNELDPMVREIVNPGSVVKVKPPKFQQKPKETSKNSQKQDK